MKLTHYLALAALASASLLKGQAVESSFRVSPYVQNPTSEAISVLWIAERPHPGRLRCWEGQRLVWEGQDANPRPAEALLYSPWEEKTFGARAPGFQREVRIEGLLPGHRYRYEVEQDGQKAGGEFHTAPTAEQSVHFIAYSDCETEPESRGAKVQWDDPAAPKTRRPYLVDQTEGYAANLEVIAQRNPDFIVIPGDIVESGGEQRDWDEFWRHNRSLASGIPIFGVMGNHEYYGGPKDGGYDEVSSERATAKFRGYFRSPSNLAEEAERGRYYRVDYGPISLIAIDGCNGLPHLSEHDSNHHLGSLKRPHGDFNPGSIQYQWLERQLRETQQRSRFTFVAFHHCPYSSGVHGVPPGSGPGLDPQSGRPLRALTPLFLRYGVDVLLTGHDEMLERSEVSGVDGENRPRTLQVYDVGIGGDGLRGPEIENPACRFLAHRDSPEVWRDGVLQDGGKHYGHLEVEVTRQDSAWQATLTPVYVFPVMDREGHALRFERRVYPDVVKLTKRAP